MDFSQNHSQNENMIFSNPTQTQKDQKNAAEHSLKSRGSAKDANRINDLSNTKSIEGPSNDLEATNLNDMTVNNMTALDLLQETSVDKIPEDVDSIDNYGTNKERSGVD